MEWTAYSNLDNAVYKPSNSSGSSVRAMSRSRPREFAHKRSQRNIYEHVVVDECPLPRQLQRIKHPHVVLVGVVTEVLVRILDKIEGCGHANGCVVDCVIDYMKRIRASICVCACIRIRIGTVPIICLRLCVGASRDMNIHTVVKAHQRALEVLAVTEGLTEVRIVVINVVCFRVWLRRWQGCVCKR
jgi:hypothetical protein